MPALQASTENATRPPGQKTRVASVADVSKTYYMGTLAVEVLHGISLDFYGGDYISIMGPSGCGKSTLMNILGCLDRPTTGTYYLGGEDTSELKDDELSLIRGARLGFIFQSYNLIQQLDVLENIEMPLFYQGFSQAYSHRAAYQLAERVGLADRIHHKPYELSGGQQQRVAIARALAMDPLIILADEPTGNLDSRSGMEILDLFDELHEAGKTLILVTHSDELAERTSRRIRLLDGRVEQDERMGV
ncbi:MAG: ABC transporter ATP-binding protein [Gammaproteobacteria bacterium]|nr:ABC transporter ATP-binding protein [Gammaproteobacteria bacterium]MYA68436.1 ABC transporter ATP-binding protein [Gammaproteobacteria bacterium]MYC60737.1 ABC transporter ATP-binding protein [Gammaproteobacteria bacterium]MYE30218.1 ABC transporter ATP-binding protein [Gammaproteobacteria bacterium]MYH46902.1 ABC transporter ATP-binding protein [Gammaproteobacteria bacterium]